MQNILQNQNKNGVKSAGGYIITPMPDATDEEISKIEQSIFKAGAISKMLDKNMTLSEIAKAVTGDENVQLIEENIHLYMNVIAQKNIWKRGLQH